MNIILDIPPYIFIVLAALLSPRFEKGGFDKIIYLTFAFVAFSILSASASSAFYVILEGVKTNIFKATFYAKIYAIISLLSYLFYSRLVVFSRRQRAVLLIAVASFQAVIFSDTMAGILIFSEVLILATLASVLFNKSRGGIQISIFSAVICTFGFLLVLSTIALTHYTGFEFLTLTNLANNLNNKGFFSIPLYKAIYPFIFIGIYISYLIFELSVYDNSVKKERIACMKSVLLGSLLIYFFIKFFPASTYLFDLFAVIALYLLFYSSFGDAEKKPLYLLSSLVFLSLAFSAMPKPEHAAIISTYVFLTLMILILFSNFAPEIRKSVKLIMLTIISIIVASQYFMIDELFKFYQENFPKRTYALLSLYLIFYITWMRNFFLAGDEDSKQLVIKDALLFVSDILYHLSVSVVAVVDLVFKLCEQIKQKTLKNITEVLNYNFHALGPFSRTWKISDTVLYAISLLGMFLFIYYLSGNN